MKQIPGITLNQQPLSDETKEMLKLNKNRGFNNLENFNEYKFSYEYILVNETGPSHKKEFTTEVRIDNITYGKGVSNSKKESEQEAARDALSRLAK